MLDESKIEMQLLQSLETSRSIHSNIPEKDKVDYFSKLFLKPVEIRLGEDNQNIVIVERASQTSSKYTTRSIEPIDIDDFNTEGEGSLMNWKEDGRSENKNLLQLYAATPTRHIKLAICVCIYSEEQDFLNRTLQGILENYQHFVDQGMSPEEIAVIFMFDGIEKVSQSAQEFFNKMDLRSSFKWKHYARDIKDVVYEEWIDEDNVNLYTEEEIEQLEPTLFCNKRKEYFETKHLQETVKKLKNKTKKLSYDELPTAVKVQYMKALKAEYLILNPQAVVESKPKEAQEVLDLLENKEPAKREKPDSFYLYYFQSLPELKHKCICVALTEVELMTQAYFNSREETALLYSYAYDITYQKPYVQDGRLTTNPISLDTYFFLVVKNKNAGKLSSQNWFFKGFCELMKPDSTILLDVGLRPAGDALFKMYKYLSLNPNCGGVCGYMGLALEKPFNDLGVYENENHKNFDCLTKFSENFFDIQKAQRFEYHFAHMLDKPFESFFGFINVLPGAFSGYNMNKLFKNNDVLAGYFKSLTQGEVKLLQNPQSSCRLLASVFLPRNWLVPKLPEKYEEKTAYESLKEKNVYLAEDRILCLGIFEQGMTMAYLPDAWATVDSVTTMRGFLGQRRRWINGSYFAFEKVTDTANLTCEKLGFACEMLFYFLNNAVAYISIALFFITLDLTATTFINQTIIPASLRYYGVDTIQQLQKQYILGFINPLKLARSFQPTVNFIYVAMLGTLIFMSLNLSQTNPKFQKKYMLISTIMGWYSIGMYILMAITVINYNSAFNIEQKDAIVSSVLLRWMIYATLIIHALPPIASFILIKFDINYIFEVISSAPSYLFYGASYLHILNIFAYCRIDDVTWGTKGLTDGGAKQTKIREAWETEKYIFISRYITWNIIAAIALVYLVRESGPKSVVIACFTCYVCFNLLARFLCGVLYLIRYKCKSPGLPKKDPTKFPDLKFRRIYYILKPEVMIAPEQGKSDEEYVNEYLEFCKINHIMGQRVLNGDMARASVQRNVAMQRNTYRASIRPTGPYHNGVRNSKWMPRQSYMTGNIIGNRFSAINEVEESIISNRNL